MVDGKRISFPPPIGTPNSLPVLVHQMFPSIYCGQGSSVLICFWNILTTIVLGALQRCIGLTMKNYEARDSMALGWNETNMDGRYIWLMIVNYET